MTELMGVNREKVHDTIKLTALLMFVVSLPFSLVLNNIAIIILTTNWVFESDFLTKWNRAKTNRFFVISLSLFYILSAIGLLYTTNIHQGLFEMEKRIPLLAFPLIFSTSKPLSNEHIRVVFKFFVFTCIVASIICLAYAFYRNYTEGHTLSYVFRAIFFDVHLPGRYYYLNYYYFTHHFFSETIQMHPTYLAMYILFSCCLITWLWWKKSEENLRMRIVIILLLIYNWLIILLLSSRTQMFTLLILGTAFILHHSSTRKNLLKGVLLMLSLFVIGGTLILLNPISRERFTKAITPGVHYSEQEYGEGGLSLRLYNWKYTIMAIQDDPLIGVGTGDMQDELQQEYKRNNFKIGYENELNPHNQYLESILELGLGGLLAITLPLFLPLYSAYKKRIWLYFAFILMIAIGFITESILQLNKGIVFYSFFNSLLLFNFLKADVTSDRELETLC